MHVAPHPVAGEPAFGIEAGENAAGDVADARHGQFAAGQIQAAQTRHGPLGRFQLLVQAVEERDQRLGAVPFQIGRGQGGDARGPGTVPQTVHQGREQPAVALDEHAGVAAFLGRTGQGSGRQAAFGIGHAISSICGSGSAHPCQAPTRW